jgi:hypothetical protein
LPGVDARQRDEQSEFIATLIDIDGGLPSRAPVTDCRPASVKNRRCSCSPALQKIERFRPHPEDSGHEIALAIMANPVFGGRVVHAQKLMHGKVSPVHHTEEGVFRGLPNPLTCTRYHSLAVERKSLPACLEVTAWTDDGEIMGLRHKTLAVEGVQFHPESILTECGHDLVARTSSRSDAQ